MKLLIITFALAFSVFSQNAFADETKVSPIVLKSFQHQFTTATAVDWTITANFYKVQFVLNDQHVTAFYEGDGNLIAVIRNITSDQLPVKLQAELKKDLEHNWISELFEITNEEGTEYYVTLENADVKQVLRSASYGTWSNYLKSKK